MRFDGETVDGLAAAMGAGRLVVLESAASTMDEAHALAQAGAPDGTVVIAERQTAGRGRLGRSWTSEPGLGLWMTLVARQVPASGLDVLSLRVGLAIAPMLEPFADGAITLKWPNDVLIGRKKLAGILVEARWREALPEWVAVGVGVNLVPPGDQPGAIGLRAGTSRAALATALVPAIRAACRADGHLSLMELEAFSARDAMRGAELRAPVAGRARGIDRTGALAVETASGVQHFRRGSLALAEEGE